VQRWVLCYYSESLGWLPMMYFETAAEAANTRMKVLEMNPGDDSKRFLVMSKSRFEAYEQIRKAVESL